MADKENTIVNKHLLVCFENQPSVELDYIKNNFCGIVLSDVDNINKYLVQPNTIIYLCGNIKYIYDNINIVNENCYVIKELSYNYENHNMIDTGKVPINVYNVGVYFRNFFDNKKYFELLTTEHQFKTLTESNKAGIALRKGIYLTKVEQIDDKINFNLLRCSTNFNSPTDNLRNTDIEILDKVNNIAQLFFKEKVEFNHVLAQVYENTKSDGKERKAKIKAHSDKTKDMSKNALIAFCTFYDMNKLDQTIIDCNYCYKSKSGNELRTSILTKLRFKLKPMVADPNLVKQFDITLYPNSLFIIPLSTNRLYTHETVSSSLPIDKIPTRLGYVVRCSNTKAVFMNNKTYINGNIELKHPNENEIEYLKQLYYKENKTDEFVYYNNIIFSMNEGDYMKPII